MIGELFLNGHHAPRRGPHPQRPQRGLAASVAALATVTLLALALALAPALTRADMPSSLTVVGTSDVSDSGLMQNLIQPMFSAAYPQFTFKYTGTASGTAISNAETGAGGPSVLIVHAATLENQFVAGGFSDEPFGRAIFINDFVLAGPSGSDPAGVTANGAHDVVQAFAGIATAGNNGGGSPQDEFVSRGGTPGTTTQEHKIWAQVAALPSPPAGVLLCAVSAANGGGDTPIAAGNGVTASGQPCPNGGALPTGSALPKWYVVTGLTQGPNVVAANACAGYPSSACYVFTDRGTYDYLASGSDGGVSIPNLRIVTRDDSATAPGGADELINYFHAYIIKPTVAGETVNLTAAQDFVNFLTSPTLQSKLKTYLASTSDPGGPPFVADASPIITASGIPAGVLAGKTVTVTGTVTNAEPGYPVLTGKTVSVDEVVGGLPVAVGSGTTGASGNYTITYTPPASGQYQVSTGLITQIENSTLNPPFGDLLSPASTAPTATAVHGVVSVTRATGERGGVTVAGAVGPVAPDGHDQVVLSVRRQGAAGYRKIGAAHLVAGQGVYAVNGNLAAGRWRLRVTLSDPGQLEQANSRIVTVTVPTAKQSHSVRFTRITDRTGRITVSGTLSPAAVKAGARIELFALRLSKLKSPGSGAASPRFREVAHLSLPKRGSGFSFRLTETRGYQLAFQLGYVQKGAASSFSTARAVAIP